MNKFGREYLLTVQTLSTSAPSLGFASSEFLAFSYPLTLEFDVQRKLYQSLNTGHFRLYNLSTQHRNQVRHSAWNIGEYQQIQLRAGYSTDLTLQAVANLPVIFQGNITQASSVRDGSNFVTTIEALDGGFAFAYPQVSGNPLPTFAAGTKNQTIVQSLAESLKPGNVSVGAIGSYGGKSGRGASFSDPAQNALAQYTGSGFFIDNEVANALNTDEVIEDTDTLIISAASGLLNTPQLENSWLYFDMIFEPRLYLGQLIILDSVTDFLFNGPAKVGSIHHRGTISGAVCGDAITTVGLDVSVSNFVPVPRAIS